MSALRPLALGEIVDRAVAAWRAQWRPLYLLFLGFELAQYALLKGWQVAMGLASPDASPEAYLELLRADPERALRLVPLMGGSLLVVSAATLVTTQLAAVAGTLLVYPRLLERPAPGLGEAVRAALGRLGPLAGVLVLSSAWALLVGLLACLPGGALSALGAVLARDRPALGAVALVLGVLVLGASLLGLLLWYVLRFFFVPQVLALEPGGAVHCFRRSGALASGRVAAGLGGWVKVRLSVVITVVGLILTVISTVAELPQFLVAAVSGGHPAQGLLVPAELIAIALSSVVAPLWVVFQVTFYVDLRVRREGLDLELALSEQPA